VRERRMGLVSMKSSADWCEPRGEMGGGGLRLLVGARCVDAP
jgi:hypothetical protein